MTHRVGRPRSALALVLVLAALAAWAGRLAQDSRAHQHANRVEAAARHLLQERADALDATTRTLVSDLAALGPAALVANAPSAGLSSPVLVDAKLQLRAGSPSTADAGELTSDSNVHDATQLAADQGVAVAATSKLSKHSVTVVVLPMYSRGGLVGTADRRQALTGWALMTVDPASVAGAVRSALLPLDSALRVDGPLPVSAGPVDGVILASYSPDPGSPHPGAGVPVVLALLVLLVGGAAVELVARGRARRTELESHVVESRRQMALLADLGATAQGGMDLSLTLPAVLTQLQAGLDLSHLVVRTRTTAGGGEVLALGSHPEAGTTVSLPLHRALRTIGVLEVTSREPLSSESHQVLEAAADIIAGFLHNSELFEREQLAVARLQNLDRLKDDFLGTVSHELRTPLTIIVGFLAMLRSRWRRMTDEERMGAFATISNHATALTALVNDLLDFVTDRRGADQIQLKPASLAAPVEEIVERFTPLFADHSLTVDLDEDVLAVTDARAVERILTNLLSNAVKYSPAQSLIEVHVKSVEDGAAVAVRDHGPGIAPEDRELVFERFYRGSTDAARGTRGTGIGLTIVKTWLELVGARLEVRSAPGEGTDMTVVFPREEGVPLDEAGHIVWRELAEVTGRAS